MARHAILRDEAKELLRGRVVEPPTKSDFTDSFNLCFFSHLLNRPTLQFSESTVSDMSPPESINLSREESYLSLEPLYFNSVSRSSSERSGTGARDILVSPLGEATEFLPIKVIAPEMQADIQELLTPIFEDYHRVMVRDLYAV